MTPTTEVRVVLTGDGKQLASTAREASGEIDKLKSAATDAGDAIGTLGERADDASTGLDRHARSADAAAVADVRLTRANQGASTAAVTTGRSFNVLQGQSQQLTGSLGGVTLAGNRARSVGIEPMGKASVGAAGAARGLTSAAAGLTTEATAAGVASTGAAAGVGRLGLSAAAAGGPVGVAALVVAALAAAMFGAIKLGIDYGNHIDDINARLAINGARWRTNAVEISDAANDIARSTSQSYADIEDALVGLASTGEFTRYELEQVGLTGANIARAFRVDVGEGVERAAAIFRAMADEDLPALYDSLALLNDDALRGTVLRLTEAGETAEAQRLVMEALARQAAGAPGSVSDAFGNLTGAVGDWVGAMINSMPAVQALRNLMNLLADAASSAAAEVRDAVNAGAGANNQGGENVRLTKIERLQRPPEPSRVSRGGRSGRGGGGGGGRRVDPADRWEDQIDRLQDGFSALPSDILRVQNALEQVDELLVAIGDRPGPRFDQMRAELEALKPVIRESLAAPIRDMLRDQEREIALLTAAARGRADEVEQMRLQQALMERLGAQSEEQLAIALQRRGIGEAEYRQLFANLQIMEQLTAEEERRNAARQYRLNELDRFEGNVRETISDLRSDGLGAFTNFLDRLLDQVADQWTDQIFNELFGGIFSDLEAELSGRDAVVSADKAMATSIEATASSLRRLSVRIDAVANGQPTAANAGLVANSPTDQEPPNLDLVVTATRSNNDLLGRLMTGLFQSFLGSESVLAQDMGKYTATALKGAIEGQIGSSIASSLGIRQSRTGAAIGGGIGRIAGEKLLTSALGSLGSFAGPIGSIVGGLLGGTIGGLFKKTKYGTASVGLNAAGLTSSVAGNSGSYRGAATGGAQSIIQGLQSIASQLGGFITGSPSVSIGQYKDNWRVSTTGYTGKLKKGAPGVVDFGKDGEQQAIAYAMLDALKDGTIGGLSDAVRSALTSNTDIEAAIREAMQVDEIEQLLGGFGEASRKAFVDFERQAKERLRIAGKYGFDLVKLEETNQKQRQALLDDAIDSAVGGLRSLLTDMLSGERAAGTLTDRRAALLARKAELEPKAASDADAADELARVLEQLYDVSLAAYGSAGAEFSGDRSTIQSSAEAIIAAASAELKAAQDKARGAANGDSGKSTEQLIGDGNAQLVTMVGLLNEGNDQMAQLLALARGGGGSGGSIIDFSGARELGRTVLE